MGTGSSAHGCAKTGFFVQDSWRWKPNFTVNLGLRYDAAVPVLSAEQQLLDGDDRRRLRRVWRRVGRQHRDPCNLFQPGVHAGQEAAVRQLREGHVRLQHRLQQLRAERRVRLDAQRQGRAARRACSATRPFVRGGYTRAFSRNGMNDFTGLYKANPGVTIQDADRTHQHRQPEQRRPGPSRALPAVDAARSGAVPELAGLSDDRRRHRGHQHVRLRTSRCRTPTPGRSACSADSARTMAVEVRYVGTPVARELWQTLELQRDQHLRERVPERVQGGAGESRGEHRGRPRRHVRLHRCARHGAAADDLRLLPRN